MKLQIEVIDDHPEVDPLVQTTLEVYQKIANDRSTTTCFFETPGLPMSANAFMRRGKFGGMFLDERVTKFHETVKRSAKPFDPEGVFALVAVFSSPSWVTKAREVRKKDVDNMLKVSVDAFSKAVRVPDERIWAVHGFKVYAKRESTTFYAFDLGTVVTHCIK
jgi:Holliday junction resolvase RusA-like endonuclease